MDTKAAITNFEGFELKLEDVDTKEPLVMLLVITSLLQVIKTDSEVTSESDKANLAMMIAMMEKQFKLCPETEKQTLGLLLMDNLEAFVKEIRDSIDTKSDS
jgi:hypothetical protein